jgi:hypothetical protein
MHAGYSISSVFDWRESMAVWDLGRRVAGACGALAFFLAPLGAINEAAAATVVIQRTTIYINTLPRGCVKTTYSGGVVVWKCGALYYQPYDGRYVRVTMRYK